MSMPDAVTIGIVGAGAMGSLFARRFIHGGFDTFLLERDAESLEIIKEGILFVDNGRRERVPVRAESDPDALRSCSHIFIFVKSYDTEAAIETVAPRLSPSAVLITLQNGLGNRETILRRARPESLIYGTTTMGAARGRTGEIIFGGEGETVIGGGDPAALRELRNILRSSGFAVRITGDPDRALWEKAVINASINPLGALLEVPNGAIADSPHLSALQDTVVQESVNVSQAMGIPLDGKDLSARAVAVCRATAGNRCSMLQDIEAGRRTEIESINGKIAEYGKAAGIAAPCNETLVRLIKAKEGDTRRKDGR